MQVLVLNDTRADSNPGCQATVSMLVHHLSVTLHAEVRTRPRGEGYDHFSPMVAAGRAHSPADWYRAVTRLDGDSALAEAVGAADLVVANLEGTFHHHAVGALALGGAIAVAHRAGTPVWAVNGTVEGIDPWLLAAALMPAQHVAVREPRSARWLAARGIIATAAADAAFLAAALSAQRDAPGAATRSVFYTPGVVQSTTASRATAVADILTDLRTLADAGWEPTFVQFEDRESSLADAVREQGWLTTDGRAVPWPAFGAWLRHFALVVSGRYHVLIFAAMAGVPAIARRSNTHKIEGLLDLLARHGALARDAATLRDLLAGGA
ncbi:MAG: polysaccharide pyruvyl transferase family protein, partial [Acidobacteriota bacterium]